MLFNDPVSGLHNVDDRMINKYDKVGGMRIRGGN
jgi:hypothetical protein